MRTAFAGASACRTLRHPQAILHVLQKHVVLLRGRVVVAMSRHDVVEAIRAAPLGCFFWPGLVGEQPSVAALSEITSVHRCARPEMCCLVLGWLQPSCAYGSFGACSTVSCVFPLLTEYLRKF